MSIIVSMSLDFAECDRARLARDPVYDGRFYTGVHSTGIYCRPVCPVRPARSANVSFFPSAAAAEAAGFRPCLRCRPETAPFCSAWIGSRATVESLRRFNSVFAEVYGRPPTEIRRKRSSGAMVLA